MFLQSLKEAKKPLLYEKYKYFVRINILFKLNITSIVDKKKNK